MEKLKNKIIKQEIKTITFRSEIKLKKSSLNRFLCVFRKHFEKTNITFEFKKNGC